MQRIVWKARKVHRIEALLLGKCALLPFLEETRRVLSPYAAHVVPHVLSPTLCFPTSMTPHSSPLLAFPLVCIAFPLPTVGGSHPGEPSTTGGLISQLHPIGIQHSPQSPAFLFLLANETQQPSQALEGWAAAALCAWT